MKITRTRLSVIILEEIRRLLKENHHEPDTEGEDVPSDPELTPDQLASLEEPMDATADMSDEEVMRLAAALAAEAESWGDEDW